MTTLTALQKRWQQAILQDAPEDITDVIALPPRDSAEIRVRIYTEGYVARLLEVLEVTFPALCQWLSEENFYAAGGCYLQAYPSYYFSVGEIGKDFSTFLQQSSLPFISSVAYSEMAALEWAICAAVDRGDATPLTKEMLTQIPQDQWGELQLHLHPSLALLSFQTNVLTIYQAYVQKQPFPAAENVETNYCRVWRKAQQVYYVSMSQVEYIFLDCIQRQQTFGEICDVLGEYLPEDEVVNFAIQQLLRNMEEGILTGATV